MSAVPPDVAPRTAASLRLAPDPGLAATARLFVAAIARRAGAGEERVDDLKLAVSEAFAAGIAQSSPVEIDVTPEDDRVAVRVRGSGVDRAGDAPDAPIGRLELIRALVGDLETSPGSIGFSVSLA